MYIQCILRNLLLYTPPPRQCKHFYTCELFGINKKKFQLRETTIMTKHELIDTNITPSTCIASTGVAPIGPVVGPKFSTRGSIKVVDHRSQKAFSSLLSTFSRHVKISNKIAAECTIWIHCFQFFPVRQNVV